MKYALKRIAIGAGTLLILITLIEITPKPIWQFIGCCMLILGGIFAVVALCWFIGDEIIDLMKK